MIYHFEYRGGEILADVEAETEDGARELLTYGAVLASEVQFWYLHQEFWELVDKEDDR